MSPEALAHVLRPLQDMFDPKQYPSLLVGLGSPDDAAVYRLDDERALILTTDFFTPVVDDPYDYGAIAAANALSDIYAMGGSPFLALSLVAFPSHLPNRVLEDVMRGMGEMVRAAGAVIAGGHSIRDDEPKVGLCVAGFASPHEMLTKGEVRAGDVLVLTKPLGTGVVTTAAKANRAAPEYVAEAVRWMKRLNRDAARCALAAGARGGTDITGFGLMGHAWEMAQASGMGLRIILGAVPFLDGVQRFADQGISPGGAKSNRLAYEKHVRLPLDICEGDCMLLFDPQTSGGLLLAIPRAGLSDFEGRMRDSQNPYWIIGEAVSNQRGIEVI